MQLACVTNEHEYELYLIYTQSKNKQKNPAYCIYCNVSQFSFESIFDSFCDTFCAFLTCWSNVGLEWGGQ